MKYKIFCLFLVLLVVFSVMPAKVVNAVNPIPMGGGVWYNTVTGMYSDSSSGSCTMNDTCAPTLNEFNDKIAATREASFQSAYTAAGGQSIVPSRAIPTGNLCIPGTMTGTVYSDGSGQCSALINGQLQTITYCTGKETTGPCRPERVDAAAAANAALAQSIKTGQSCSAQFVGFPGVDPNTGLGYYYNISCTTSSSGGGTTPSSGGSTPQAPSSGSSSGQGSTSVSGATQTSSQVVYINALLNIIRNLTAKLTQSLQSQNTKVAVFEPTVPAVTPGAVSSVPSVSNSRLQQIISQANTLSYGSLTADERTSLTNYLTTNRTALIDQNFQTFAPGTVFAWALSMGTGTVPNAEARSLGFAIFDTGDQLFKKTYSPIIIPGTTITGTNAVFTSNASGVMKVGDAWSVVISGLKANETIYAQGGKKVNGVVPTDKTPYYANAQGIMIKSGTHTADVIGDWQLVWTRADGSPLSTLNFSVIDNSLLATFCSATNDNSQSCADKAQAQARARGYNATCTVSVGGALCTINGSTGHSAALLVGTSSLNTGWNTLRTELIREGIITQ